MVRAWSFLFLNELFSYNLEPIECFFHLFSIFLCHFLLFFSRFLPNLLAAVTESFLLIDNCISTKYFLFIVILQGIHNIRLMALKSTFQKYVCNSRNFSRGRGGRGRTCNFGKPGQQKASVFQIKDIFIVFFSSNNYKICNERWARARWAPHLKSSPIVLNSVPKRKVFEDIFKKSYRQSWMP